MSGWARMAWRSLVGALVAALTLWGATWAAERHSGTIVAIDKTAGTIVVGEVGPWRVKGGEIEITNRTLTVTGGTKVVRVERRTDAGPAGWPGGFVEVSLGAWDVKEADFVTVEAERLGKRLVALKITVVRP